MCKYNDCEKCPYYSSYIPYWSEDGCLVETCGAGLNPEEGCKHILLVRWVLFKREQRRITLWEKNILKDLEEEQDEV